MKIHKFISIVTILIIVGLSYDAHGQEKMSLEEALITVASQRNVSIIFNPDWIPNKQVLIPDSDASINAQLGALLSDTKIEFDIRDAQIFLFKRHTLSGFIEDGQTGERLIYATMYNRTEDAYTSSNEYGAFSLETISDSVSISTSYIGYETKITNLRSADNDQPLFIKMDTDNQVDEIVISDALASPAVNYYHSVGKGTNIRLHQAQAVSAVGGEPDIFQAMIRQAGVNAGTDGIGGIHTRGGRNDQNLVLFDGVRLYNSAHGFGVFSIINNEVINQSTFHKSGVDGAQFGRLSSILDVRSSNPDLHQSKATAQVSTVASQASVQVPIIKDKLSISLSARRTHIDPIINYLSEQDRTKTTEDYPGEFIVDEGRIDYRFYDINFKAYAKLDNAAQLTFSAFQSQDSYASFFSSETQPDTYYTYRESEEYDWKNRFFVLKYNRPLSNRTFMDIQLSNYTYDYQNRFLQNEEDQDFPDYYRYFLGYDTEITNNELRVDMQSTIRNHYLKYGISLALKAYNIGDTYTEDIESTISDQPFPDNIPIDIYDVGKYQGQDVTVYLSDKYRLSSKTVVDGGLYLNYFHAQEEFLEPFGAGYLSPFGYLRLQHLHQKNITIGASASTSIQQEHLLTTGDSGYPSDIWVPSNSLVSPARAQQLEVFGKYNDDHHNLSIAAYLKKQQNIAFFDSIATLPSLTILESDNWEFATAQGEANGYGIEVDYAYQWSKRSTIKAAYTYNVTDYTFDVIEDGAPFPYDYSIPHTISIGANIGIGKLSFLSFDWYYASGRPYTLYSASERYTPLERDSDFTTEQLSNYNALRLQPAHKLSLAFGRRWQWGNVRNDFLIGIQNVYNRKNQLYLYELDGEGPQSQSGFPLLPMVRWRIEI